MSIVHGPDTSSWYIRKLRLNSGGYTSQGYYYGLGLPLYECYNNSEYKTFRADDRVHAIEQLIDSYKGYNLSFAKKG